MSRPRLRTRLAFAALTAVLAACGPPLPQGPDMILTGGRIYVDGGPDLLVSALAIQGTTILATGSDQEIRALGSEATQEMNLDGAVVMPGFHDAWVDIEAVGRWSQGLNLSGAATPREIQARVREIAAGSGWIVGWGWDETVWPRPELPALDLLDTVVPERPVVLYRRGGGLAWANRPALAAAGLDAEGMSRADGTATGVIFGRALQQLESVMPEPDPGQRRDWIAAGLLAAAGAGYTRVVTSPVDLTAIRAYQDLERDGDLPVIVDLRVTEEALASGLPVISGPQLQIVAAGLRVDGPVISGLAALSEPYADPAWRTDSYSGVLLKDVGEIGRVCRAAEEAGIRLDVHANGDLAVSAALDGCAALRSGSGLIVGADLMPTSAAASLATARFAVAPFRMAHDMYWLDERLGAERSLTVHPYRDLVAAGTLSAVASLAPAHALAPMASALIMWTRRDLDGYPIDGWNGPQRISVGEAIAALLGGAGRQRLQAGEAADIVIWSEDPHIEQEVSLRQARALLTLVGGRVTYSRPLRELPFDRN